MIRLVVYLRVAGRATLIRDLLRVDTSVMLNSILVDSFAINGARTRFDQFLRPRKQTNVRIFWAPVCEWAAQDYIKEFLQTGRWSVGACAGVACQHAPLRSLLKHQVSELCCTWRNKATSRTFAGCWLYKSKTLRIRVRGAMGD